MYYLKALYQFSVAGEIDFFEHLLLEGYDHIRDVVDAEENGIVQVARTRGQTAMAEYLEGLREFEVG